MAKSIRRIELIDVNKIVPSKFRIRTSIEKKSLKEMAKTIKMVGLLQPISVRPKGRKYEIIQGERRWRAAKLAGLKKIPAIVKDVDDRRMMLESLIENVHREDLDPVEKAEGLAEVYRLAGFEPADVASALKSIERSEEGRLERRLNNKEKKIKEIADMVGLSYDYQYRLLTILRLPKRERKLASKLGIGYEELSSIATIEEPEIRRRIIEIAPERKRTEIKKIAKITKKAPKEIIKAVLKRRTRITPTVAEKLLELPKEKQKEAIKQIESLRLTEEEAIAHIEAMKIEVPSPPPEALERIRERYKELVSEVRAKLESPEARKRGELFRNWIAHIAIAGLLETLSCPVCGSKELGWLCHDLTIKEALKRAETKYKKSLRR